MATVSFLFKKKLQKTDVNHRLSVPSHCLSLLPELDTGGSGAGIQVVDEGGREWEFRLCRRSKGYSKPVLSKGWVRFVHHWGLGVGDVVSLCKVQCPCEGVWYGIRVARRVGAVRLFGVEINPTADVDC